MELTESTSQVFEYKIKEGYVHQHVLAGSSDLRLIEFAATSQVFFMEDHQLVDSPIAANCLIMIKTELLLKKNLLS